MDTRDIRDLVHFTDDGPRHDTLFESEHLWSEVICIKDAQGMGPIADPASDALITVLTGEVAIQIGKGRARMKQWESSLVPAGAELTLRNASPEPAVLLLVTAPPPAPAAR